METDCENSILKARDTVLMLVDSLVAFLLEVNLCLWDLPFGFLHKKAKICVTFS